MDMGRFASTTSLDNEFDKRYNQYLLNLRTLKPGKGVIRIEKGRQQTEFLNLCEKIVVSAEVINKVYGRLVRDGENEMGKEVYFDSSNLSLQIVTIRKCLDAMEAKIAVAPKK